MVKKKRNTVRKIKRIKMKTTAKKMKAWNYKLKNSKDRSKNILIHLKPNMNAKEMLQVLTLDFMTVKINLNRSAEERVRLITIIKVSHKKKSTLMTINRVFHNFPNFPWAAATPKDRLEKFLEDETIELIAFESLIDIFLWIFLNHEIFPKKSK